MTQTENQASEALQCFIEEVHSFCLRYMSTIRVERAAREKQLLVAELGEDSAPKSGAPLNANV